MKKTVPSRRDRIRSTLADLKMPGALEELDPIPQHINGGQLTAGEAIESLLSAQISLRNNRRMRTDVLYRNLKPQLENVSMAKSLKGVQSDR